jgi:DNA-binding response OmpR family regulator
MKRKILYVEDEPFLGKIVTETLEKLEFEVRWEIDGKRAMNHFTNFMPEICVLDIMLPNIDGYTLCKEIRRSYPVLPIIFLTARAETSDLIKGFESGGTDYIRKPFSLEELIARINNQLNMISGIPRKLSPVQECIKLGIYSFYPQRYELHSPDAIVKLSQREMEVLSILISDMNRIVERKNLLLTVWGDDSFFNSRNLDVYIRKLRQYFMEDPLISIQTLKGKGYLFMVPQ